MRLVDSKSSQHETVWKYQPDHQGENPSHRGVGLVNKYLCLVWVTFLQAGMEDLGIHQARHKRQLISYLVVFSAEKEVFLLLSHFALHQYCNQHVTIGKCGNQNLLRESSWIMQIMHRIHKGIRFFISMTSIFSHGRFPDLVFKEINIPFKIQALFSVSWVFLSQGLPDKTVSWSTADFWFYHSCQALKH